MNQGRVARMGAILVFLATSVVTHANNKVKEFPAVNGEYIVKLKNSTQPLLNARLESILGGEIKSIVNTKERLVVVKRSIVETRDAVVQSLSHNPYVQYAEPNYIYHVVGHANSLPTDDLFGRLWGLKNTGQTASGDGGDIQGIAGIDIGAEEAWKVETGSSDVLVAVIDTGVNYKLDDLAPNIYTNQAEANGQPQVDDDNNGCVDDIHGCDFVGKDGDPMDVYGHGTHVSGTMGATANNGGIVGVAWNMTILPVRFLGDDGSGTLEDAIKSIDYATAMHVKIMSNSWGGGGFSQALQDSIQRAKDAGILFIAAAGNEANDNDSQPSYPASYQLDNVISVAAINPRGTLADFSNFGKTSVHVAAPGVDVWSYTMKGTESWSGTSMATPHVSGVAALVWSQDLQQDYATVKNRILKGARTLPGLRGRVATNGLVNAYYSLTNTVAPLDPSDPFNWQKDAQTVSTPHPYANKFTQTWTLKVPGAKNVAVYFSRFETEGNFDKVSFADANGKDFGHMSGMLGETMSPVVDGDTVVITFTSDDSVNKYGFDIGGVAYH